MCNNRRHFGHKAKCCKGKLLIALLCTKFAMLRRRSSLFGPATIPSQSTSVVGLNLEVGHVHF
jgi:hypothetical protein